MNLDAPSLIASFLIGLIGFAIFVYGKKQRREPHLVAGLVLMVFPYFVPNAVAMVGIATAVVGAAWLAVQRGY